MSSDRLDRRDRLNGLADRAPTAPLAAFGLLAGFGVAVASGSRPLGGLVMGACGLTCIAVWVRRDGRRTAAWLTAAGLVAFAISHLLGLVIGAWPSVIVVSAATGGLCWWLSDSRRAADPVRGEAAVSVPDVEAR